MNVSPVGAVVPVGPAGAVGLVDPAAGDLQQQYAQQQQQYAQQQQQYEQQQQQLQYEQQQQQYEQQQQQYAQQQQQQYALQQQAGAAGAAEPPKDAEPPKEEEGMLHYLWGWTPLGWLYQYFFEAAPEEGATGATGAAPTPAVPAAMGGGSQTRNKQKAAGKLPLSPIDAAIARPGAVLDIFNASAPFYNHSDLMAAADWSVFLHDLVSGKPVSTKRTRDVFETSRVGRHVVDLFSKTVMALAGSYRHARVLEKVYEAASSRYPRDSETHLLLFLLYKKVTRRGRVSFKTLLKLHAALLKEYTRARAHSRVRE